MPYILDTEEGIFKVDKLPEDVFDLFTAKGVYRILNTDNMTYLDPDEGESFLPIPAYQDNDYYD